MNLAAIDMRSSAFEAARRWIGFHAVGMSVVNITSVPFAWGCIVHVFVAVPTIGGIPSIVYASEASGSQIVIVSTNACCAICTRLVAPTPEV